MNKDVPIIGQPKKYFFEKDELDYLKPRYIKWLEYRMIADSLEMDYQTYLIRKVLKRLSIDVNKQKVDYNLEQGTLTVTNLPTNDPNRPDTTGDREDKGNSPAGDTK